MNLVNYNELILKQKQEQFDFYHPPYDPIEFSQELVKMMHESGGIGLSAPQVGVPHRIFAMRGNPNFVCFNPRIVMKSEDSVMLEETCMSYPQLLIKIKRPQHIRVRFQTPNGETRTEQFTGLTARVFQHEMEHLDGNMFYKDATFFHRTTALKKWIRKNS